MRRVLEGCVLGLAVAVAGCGSDGADDAAPAVTRRDSAGVAIVENRGGDRTLDWRFEEVMRVGGADEGPEAFFQVGGVGTDARGWIYVLDAGNHRVAVFDSTGAPVRTMGGQGGGPGELQMPGAIAVRDDGVVGVQDYGKGGIVRWDSAGEPIDELRQIGPMLWRLQATPDGFAGMFAELAGFGAEADSTRYRLARLQGDTSTLASLAVAPGKPADLGCVKIAGLPPLFQPRLETAALEGGGFAVSSMPAYEIRHLDAQGRLVALVRRDVAPEQTTGELAAREVGDSMRVSFGGNAPDCAVGPAKVVEQRGYEALIPAVRGVLAAGDGGWWVYRGVGPRDDQYLDVFDADGGYIGTLPEDAPHPEAFLDGDRFVAIEKDELDVPYVVLYRIDRGVAKGSERGS